MLAVSIYLEILFVVLRVTSALETFGDFRGKHPEREVVFEKLQRSISLNFSNIFKAAFL